MATLPNRNNYASRKEIISWAMFDFANSSYTTVIITVVYAVVFPRLIVGDGPDFKLGNFIWGLAQSISYIAVVLTSPLFGAIMDFKAVKKKFLFASYLITIVATASLFFVSPGAYIIGALVIIISNFGFSIGESFVSSFLPDLGPPENLGKISGYAWGLGYFGGLLSTAFVMFALVKGDFTLANFDNLRLIGPVTAIFFLVAAIPTFVWVKERGQPTALAPDEEIITVGFKRVYQTFKHIGRFRELSLLLISIFFAMAGLSIVISYAFIYGDQVIKWQSSTQMLMFIITQFTAAFGAILFGIIQDKIGAKKTFSITLIMWCIAILLLWSSNELTRLLNLILNTQFKHEYIFLAIGSLTGLGLGATQSASRTLVALFSPKSKSGEFFGFWGLSGKLAAAFGVLSIGFLQAALGLQNAMLLCVLLFVIAYLITLAVNEGHGIKAAMEYDKS